MDVFQIILLDVILLIFPILVYLIYLSSNKDINNNSKKFYLKLSLLTSFFLIYIYQTDSTKLISVLMMSSIIILLYLEDFYIQANIFVILLILLYRLSFNNIVFLIIGYAFIAILYIFKKNNKIKNPIFIQLYVLVNTIVYYIWIYKYNYDFYNIKLLLITIISYIFITNIICLMYKMGKHIIEVHMTYKELQQEKQIRLSLFKITHEIKNPIAVCKGYLDMINTNDNDQVERYIPIIKSEIDRLLSLLQDFLLINKNNLDLDIMDFNMLIEDTINKLNPLLKDNNINLKLNLLDEEVFINGDYNRLSQVIINIIKNSIEAMNENKNGRIKISSKLLNNKYLLTIEDNGIGMDKETLSKIKEPFFTTKRNGSGLGVSVIYEIIEAHGGKVEYSSVYGKGTKILIKIPVYE